VTLRTEVYAPIYQQSVYPPNLWKEEPHDNLQQVTKAILASIRKFMDRDIITKRR
jgi:hypothetical protein